MGSCGRTVRAGQILELFTIAVFYIINYCIPELNKKSFYFLVYLLGLYDLIAKNVDLCYNTKVNKGIGVHYYGKTGMS